MRVIGYGICGPGEAKRYMRETLEEFARLCDEVMILCNNTHPDEEDAMIEEFGFHMVQDTREWGKLQWKIKEDFVSNHVSKIARPGDVMVCLDMDERFDRFMTKEWLLTMPFDAYKVFVVDLWNDPEHYKPESCFWNTRIWRWIGNTEWVRKPVHCGLAPRWANAYNRYAPFLLIHKGLMAKEDRERKIKRYEKYDPHAVHLAKPYYAMLHSDRADPFDEDALHETIATEVATYKQSKPRSTPTMANKKGRFAYVKNPGGNVYDIPEAQLQETLKRPGFEFIGWADDAAAEMEELFSEDGEEVSRKDGVVFRDRVGKDAIQKRRERAFGTGSYQRGAADEKAEVDELNKRDDEALETAADTEAINAAEKHDAVVEDADTAPEPEVPATEPVEAVEAPPAPAPKKATAKKAAKKK